MGPELQIIVTFAVFLVLLICGMAVPFAIAVPAMFYLLLQGGLPALNSLGLVSWGSMNSFVLTCVPLFMLMAEILRVSGLSNRIYGGLAKLVAKLPGATTTGRLRPDRSPPAARSASCCRRASA
jgi:TRAP-type mannitol/chloroaromatic compound transport system permease large subunit